MAASAKRTIKLYEQRLADQSNWRSLWKELGEFVHPRHQDVLTSGPGAQPTPGRRQTARLYDGTAIRANELLAASMQGSLTPSTVSWFRLRPRDEALMSNERVMAWCQDTRDRAFKALANSNFTAEMQEVYLSLGAFGTGSVYITTAPSPIGSRGGFGGLQFQALQIGTYVVAEDADGRVDSVMRLIKMSARAAVGKWADKVGDKIAAAARSSNPDQLVDILHAVYPRADYNPDGKSKSSRRKKYASCYIAFQDQVLIEESGYDTFPCPTPRWAKASGESYGRGPAYTALPDIRTLNKAIQMNLRAWAKVIDPPMVALHGGLVDDRIDQRPEGLNWAYTLDALRPIDFRSRFDVTTIERQALQDAIRHCFYWDQLQLPQTQQMFTATEVERRLELMQRVLGPTLGRLESELLQPLVSRVVAILADEDQIAPPPEELLQGGDLDIEYEGPLARAQRASDIQGLRTALELSSPIAQIAPDSMDVYNWDEWQRFIAKRVGLPVELLNDQQKVDATRQEKQKARNEAAQQDAIGAYAKAAGDAGKFISAVQPGGVPTAPAGAGAEAP